MLKNLLKTFGVMAILFVSSSSVFGQTTLGIKNYNNDCAINYRINYSFTNCSGPITTISASCAGTSICYETIPAGAFVVSIVIQDQSNSNFVVVFHSNCGVTTGTYTNCDSNTADVEFDSSNNELIIND